MKGFGQKGLDAHSTQECSEKSIPFSLAIGFNVSGYDIWQQILDGGVVNIMWTVDSAFLHNFEVIKHFSSNPNFILFEVTPAEKEAVDYFLPNLKHTYLPHATDIELWKYEDVKKEHDIVFFSSISDYEQILLQTKERVTPKRFQLIMELFSTLLKNPLLNFFEAFKIYQKHFELPCEISEYQQLFKEVTIPLQQAQRAMMIAALQDFNVKIFGNGPWEKYISKNQSYLGPCDVSKSIGIVRKSKIVLHCHPAQLGVSLHERVLNASAVETFVLSSNNPLMKNEFGDNFSFFDHSNFHDIAHLADYYLKNADERQAKAKNSRLIVEQKHTWGNRAESIMEMMGIKSLI